MTTAPIILVPGFWLGAWAWDEVADALRADGHDVTALTLPGLDSVDTDRSGDHLRRPRRRDRRGGRGGAGAGRAGRAQRHRVQRVRGERPRPRAYRRHGLRRHRAREGRLDPDFAGSEKPMDWEEISTEENLDGLSEEQLATFRERAVPVPGQSHPRGPELTNDARRDIPSTLICTGFSAEQYQAYAKEHPDWAFLAGIPELRNATWVDLPTSHWPMWSRPQDLAGIIGRCRESSRPQLPSHPQTNLAPASRSEPR